MKKIRSWSIIIAATIVNCAAVGFLFLGAVWNTALIVCVELLVYAIANESKA